MADSLYIHIPFCNHICPYCDFPKVIYNPQWAFSYLDALFFEIDSLGIDKVKTIYIGGGTPSSLNLECLEALLRKLGPFLKKDYEFSLEANPDSLTREKIELLAKYGVNRVSLGVQSTIKKNLDFLGRMHCFNDVKECVSNLKEAGITNINCDLIYAYKGLTIEEIDKTLDDILSLEIPHVSAYSLILEKGTVFDIKGIKEENEDESASQYEFILNKLRSNGYKRYEFSSFCKPNRQCIHNLTYWKNKEYYAAGLGASSYINNIRYKNTLNLNSYLKKEYDRSEEVVTPKDLYEYFLLTNLRLEDGFSLDEFESIFGKEKTSDLLNKANSLLKDGLLLEEKNILRCSDRGLLLLDQVLINLF